MDITISSDRKQYVHAKSMHYTGQMQPFEHSREAWIPTRLQNVYGTRFTAILRTTSTIDLLE